MSEPTLNYLSCPDSTGGHRMAWWQWGQPTASHVVLCVHGLSRQGRDFDVLAQALCDRAPGTLRVVCPDVVGRGKSDWLKDPMGYQVPNYAADMLVLINQLQPATLDWVGTSMGGLVGMVVCGHLSAAGPSQGVKAPSGLTPAASSLPAQTGTGGRASASRRGTSSAAPASSASAEAGEVASVGAKGSLPFAVRRLVLNDVGPTIQWDAIQRIGAYLGQSVRFVSVEQAADAMWAVSTSFGPHTREQWLALSRFMVKPAADAAGGFMLHYDPAIAVPFNATTQEATVQGEAQLWQLYDNIKAATLITRGAQSDLLSIETARAMTQRGPKARLVEFAGVGHAPTFVAADQVQVVTDFLLAEE